MSTSFPVLRFRDDASAFPPGFFSRHLLVPLALALLCSAALRQAGGDLWLADAIFDLEGGRWILREHWFTSGVIHQGGKWASALGALLVLGAYAFAARRHDWRHLRQPLLYLALATALGAGSVSLLKSLTHVACPWDLARYGGPQATAAPLYATREAAGAAGHCFPAGHASAGYAWVALYFAALLWRPRWRWHGLAIGVATGLLFGAGQQLRGAHFLSHDLWTLVVCWTMSLALYCVFVRDQPHPVMSPASPPGTTP